MAEAGLGNGGSLHYAHHNEKFQVTFKEKTVAIHTLEITGLEATNLCPEARAMGDCPLGGRGSSQVLISTSTLSRHCNKSQLKLSTRRGRHGTTNKQTKTSTLYAEYHPTVNMKYLSNLASARILRKKIRNPQDSKNSRQHRSW